MRCFLRGCRSSGTLGKDPTLVLYVLLSSTWRWRVQNPHRDGFDITETYCCAEVIAHHPPSVRHIVWLQRSILIYVDANSLAVGRVGDPFRDLGPGATMQTRMP